MDSTIVAAVIGALGTIFGIWLSHYLSQQNAQVRHDHRPAPATPTTLSGPPPSGPDAANAHAQQGMKAFGAENYVLAAQELELALAGQVTAYRREDLYTTLGTTYYELDRYDEAIAAHKKALDLNPNFHQAWVNLGIVYRIISDFDQAENSYKQALRINPNYPELHASLGVLYIVRDEPDKAIASLQKALTLHPQLAVAHGNIALAYAMIGQFDKAESSLRQAAALGYKEVPTMRKRIDNLKLFGKQ
jgi:Flp pilus assembly protein TadD